MSQQLSTNTFGCAKWIVSSDATQGTHTTIGAALTSSSSGDTIFLRPGTYTENLTLKAGVNLAAYECDAFTPNVTISGTPTFSAAGTVSLSGINLQTNSAALLAVTGSAASIVNLISCNLNCTNNTGISFSSSSSSAAINLTLCKGNIGTTGITLFSHSSAGLLSFVECMINNSGASTTASTCSSGILNVFQCTFTIPITTSSTAAGTFQNTIVDNTGTNTTSFTSGGSGVQVFRFCTFNSGTASAFSAGSATPVLEGCTVSSSNTNAITGSGTLTYTPISFEGTSSTVNTTTQTPLKIGPKIYTTGGISFDGTNYLANYVTGTWTPNIQISGSNTGITYTTQLGGYTRIGNVVTIWFNILLSNKGANTGNVTISNLPITTSTNGGNQCLPVAFLNGVTAVGYTGVFLILAANSTVGQFDLTSVTGSGVLGLVGTNITNTTSLATVASYIIN